MNSISLPSSPPPDAHNNLAHPWGARQIFSPQCINRFVFLVGVFSFFLDQIFLFVPALCSSASQICLDLKFGTYIALLRTVADMFSLLGIILKFRMRHHQPSDPNNVFKRQHLHMTNSNNKHIGLAYAMSSLVIDLVSILPLPQVYVFSKLLESKTYTVPDASSSLFQIVYAQLAFRTATMSPLVKNITKKMGISGNNAWLGALVNLVYFILASNVAGALYYHMYISKLLECKDIVFDKEANAAKLDWDQMVSLCTQKYDFESGMFSDAFMTKIASRSAAQRFVYCLSWGLKSLSSFGQIFSASSYAVETSFSFLTVVFGLILFGDLLARMQTGLQCTEMREDQHRTRQRAVEEWTKYHQLPTVLKKRVKQAVQLEWSESRGINNDIIINSLPQQLRCEIRRHLYLELVRSSPVFANMDNELTNAICGHLRTFSAKEGTYLLFEGDPVRELLFIFNGQVGASNGRNSVGNTFRILEEDDLCGGELLQWSSIPVLPTDDLPLSTRTIKCVTDVEAFSLPAEDVKLLAIQYYRNKKFHQALRKHASWLQLQY